MTHKPTTQASLPSLVLAIDVGIGNIKTGLISAEGKVVHFVLRSMTPDSQPGRSDAMATALVEACREVLKQAGLTTRDLKAVGCCMPGCIDPETGVVVAAANPSWEGVDVRGPLEQSFERQVTVEGAGNAAALAAYSFGPTKGHSPLLGIVVGTGIDCGYIQDGRLLRGAGNAALEAGHMSLFQPGRPCLCGRHGCWEAHAGGAALMGILHELRAAGQKVPSLPEELSELAQATDETSAALWEEQGVILGSGIAVLLDILNPRSVVLCGGFLKSWSWYKKTLIRTAREKALHRNAQAAIVCAPEPELACLLGAAVAATRSQQIHGFFIGETEVTP